MLTMAFCLCLANYSFNDANMDKHYYIFDKSEFGEARLAFNAFFSFYLILNAYVPLDLIIVIEISKLFSTPFMESDAEMKQVVSIPISATQSTSVINSFSAHTLNLHEDMGEIEYVFADKTGTLTQNELVFRQMVILHENKIYPSTELHEEDFKDCRESAFQLANCINLCQDCMCIHDSLPT